MSKLFTMLILTISGTAAHASGSRILEYFNYDYTEVKSLSGEWVSGLAGADYVDKSDLKTIFYMRNLQFASEEDQATFILGNIVSAMTPTLENRITQICSDNGLVNGDRIRIAQCAQGWVKIRGAYFNNEAFSECNSFREYTCSGGRNITRLNCKVVGHFDSTDLTISEVGIDNPSNEAKSNLAFGCNELYSAAPTYIESNLCPLGPGKPYQVSRILQATYSDGRTSSLLNDSISKRCP